MTLNISSVLKLAETFSKIRTCLPKSYGQETTILGLYMKNEEEYAVLYQVVFSYSGRDVI
jgi:hypothetical protein